MTMDYIDRLWMTRTKLQRSSLQISQRPLINAWKLLGNFNWLYFFRLNIPLRFGFSEIATSPASVYACLLPFFFPFFTSLRLAQQQRRHNCIMNANSENAAAIHMNTNILIPILALMLSSPTLTAAILRIMKMAVARIVAMVVQSAAKNVSGAMARVAHRE